MNAVEAVGAKEKQASAFGIVVPPVGNLPPGPDSNHIALLTRLLRLDAHREGDSPFWSGASPRTLPSHDSTSPGKPH